MRFRMLIKEWQGVLLCAVGAVAILWLGATNQLQLYIHPRYIIFGVVMAVITMIFVILSLPLHNRAEKVPPAKTLSSMVTIAVCIFGIFGLLMVKPAVLTSNTAAQRSINSGIGAGIKTTDAVPLFGGGEYKNFNVKEWAALLVQTSDLEFYSGKSADITGFISPDKDDQQNVFFVSRFVVTCCAVDARPVGVPVYMPGWQKQLKADDWVQVNGSFTDNPSTASQEKIVLKPSGIKRIEQPKDPYVY